MASSSGGGAGPTLAEVMSLDMAAKDTTASELPVPALPPRPLREVVPRPRPRTLARPRPLGAAAEEEALAVEEDASLSPWASGPEAEAVSSAAASSAPPAPIIMNFISAGMSSSRRRFTALPLELLPPCGALRFRTGADERDGDADDASPPDGPLSLPLLAAVILASMDASTRFHTGTGLMNCSTTIRSKTSRMAPSSSPSWRL